MSIYSHFYSIITEASVKSDAAKAAARRGDEPHAAEPPAIGFVEAFMLPNVMSYAIAFGFFKLVSCGCVLFFVVAQFNL